MTRCSTECELRHDRIIGEDIKDVVGRQVRLELIQPRSPTACHALLRPLHPNVIDEINDNREIDHQQANLYRICMPADFINFNRH